jgi:hypothetical protein
VKYLLLIYGDESAWGSATPEDQQAEFQAYAEYTQWLQDSDLMRAGDALHPTSTATTVRVRDGKTLTTDGPFAETKEQLGGFYLIESDNLDKALEAAAKLPAAKGGSVEVRPIVEFDEQGRPK